MEKHMRLYLGIDPGLTGGMVAVDEEGELLFKAIMPIINEGTKNTIYLPGLNAKFHELNELAKLRDAEVVSCLEKVSAMPGQGVSSMFKFGRVFGTLEAMLTAHSIKVAYITPRKWTKQMHEGFDRSIGPKKRSQLWLEKNRPNLNLMPTQRSKKPHEGLLDALLLAEFGRLNAKILF